MLGIPSASQLSAILILRPQVPANTSFEMVLHNPKVFSENLLMVFPSGVLLLLVDFSEQLHNWNMIVLVFPY